MGFIMLSIQRWFDARRARENLETYIVGHMALRVVREIATTRELVLIYPYTISCLRAVHVARVYYFNHGIIINATKLGKYLAINTIRSQ